MKQRKIKKIPIEMFEYLGYEPFNEIWYSYTENLRDIFSNKEVINYIYSVPMYSSKFKFYQSLTISIMNLLEETISYVKVSYKELGKTIIDDFDTKYTKLFFKNEIINEKNIEYFRSKYLEYVSRNIIGVLILLVVNEYHNIDRIDYLVEDEILAHMLGIVNTFILGLEEDQMYIDEVLTPLIGGLYDFVRSEGLIEDVRDIRRYIIKHLNIDYNVSGIVNCRFNKNALDVLQDFHFEFIIFDITYF